MKIREYVKVARQAILQDNQEDVVDDRKHRSARQLVQIARHPSLEATEIE